MKKFFQFIGKLLGVAKGPVIEKIIDNGGELLDKFALKDPTTAAALVSSLYVFIDTVAEDAALKSKTDVDDVAIDEAKEELELFAARHGLTLQNLDAGTPND
jgi:hypothetical protein